MTKKIYHVWGQCKDSNGKKHVVTIVGVLEQKNKRDVVTEKVNVPLSEWSTVEGEMMYLTPKHLHRKLTLALSICHPKDKFDEDEGVHIALRRIKNGETLGSIETCDVTMLTKDAIMGELMVKLAHVTENIDKYLP